MRFVAIVLILAGCSSRDQSEGEPAPPFDESDAAVEAPTDAGPSRDAGTGPGPEGDGYYLRNGPYMYGPDSSRQTGVPQGALMSFTWAESTIYPGTTRKVTVYVPKQYDGSTPAALMVFQDGSSYVSNNNFKTPTVLDNLIAKKQVPIIIGVFIDSGGANRSVEYDTLSDRYVRFVLGEILPQVQTRYGLTISDDPEQRAAVGLSSGGICAFTMAWQRPDQFRRVMTHSGSFTNIRGGNKYPAMIMSSPAKPLRVFLNSGSKDLVNGAGSWPAGNQAMFDALTGKGYHVRYVFGDGGHVGPQAGTTLPETMLWLWR